jgi:hypothetical protein
VEAGEVAPTLEPPGPEEGGSEDPPRVEPDGDAPAPDVLPEVEELVAKLRPEVKTALDELFRAKWAGVKRVPAGDLKRAG